jgi:hypothetical protein
MPFDVPQDPTVTLAQVIAEALVHHADDRPALFEAAKAISHGNERVASRFGYALASAIVDELRNSTSDTRFGA